MIELIFVIVILGILAAVALPKFIGVSEQAEAGKCKALVGTLNRTVFPSLWSNAKLNGKDYNTTITGDNITDQITIPSTCGEADDYATAATSGTGFTVVIGDNTYEVNATTTASDTASPILSWGQQ